MYGIPVHVQFGHFRNHGVVPVSFFNFILLITYMETPYGGLWYAAGNPDGFRFGSVNRPSPPLAIVYSLKRRK